MINLISDTVTVPSAEMLEYMFRAKVGDDVFRADPTINELEEKVAKMFAKEAALFCPSGTMTNQIAIRVHCQALDALICDHYSHVYQYETGGYASNAQAAVQLIAGENGKITAQQIAEIVHEDYDWLPNSRLVVLENSCNKGGGSYYTLDEVAPIAALCKERGLKLHLDGARLFNVLVETEEKTEDWGAAFDSISICLSKGLGAPVGSVLIGSKEAIKKARKFRKVMGGGMRQAGYLAAAGIFALDQHIPQLKVDNDHAKELGRILDNCSFVEQVRPVQTNIVIFDLKGENTAADFISKLEKKGILATAFGVQTVRFVTHRMISTQMIKQTIEALQAIDAE